MEKDQNLTNKKIKVITAQGNHSQTAILQTDYNPSTKLVIAKDHQVDKIHKNIHKTDLVNQILKTISIELFILDQTLIEVITQTIKESVQIPTFGIDTIPITVQEFLQKNDIKFIQIIAIELNQIIDHKSILTLEHTIITKLKAPVIILELEITTVKQIRKLFSVTASK